MCANWRAVDRDRLIRRYGVNAAFDFDASRDVWPGTTAPMLRRSKDTGQRVAELGVFGLIPPWAKDRRHARFCYNARAESVATKPSFRSAWRDAHFALIPMTGWFEPKYGEDGKPVRWSIARRDGGDFAAGAIWSFWRDPVTGAGVPSFSLLTMNADEHPVMRDFHAPGEERRSIYVVKEEEWDAWLDATPELARVMVELPQTDALATAPAPLPPRRRPVTEARSDAR